MVRMDGSYPEFLTDILDFGPNCSTFEFGPHTFGPHTFYYSIYILN